MVTDRLLEERDLPLLSGLLETDEHHKGTPLEFFTQLGTICKVYEDDGAPIMFVRATKALRLDIQFIDNNDARRNLTVMMEGFPALVNQARDHGFTEIIFCTSSPLLKKFCLRRLGFEQVEGDELRRFI